MRKLLPVIWTDRSFSELLKGMPQEKLLFLEAETLKGSVVLHEEAEDISGCAVPGFCCPGCYVLELHSSFLKKKNKIKKN